jgi:hypothetical protein
MRFFNNESPRDGELLFGISRERSIRQQLNNDKARVLL